MLTSILRAGRDVYRCILHRKSWRYDSVGYCTSCGSSNIFIHALDQRAALANLIDSWNTSSNFKKKLLERENYTCTNCMANFRQRAHADTALKVLGLAKTEDLIDKLKYDHHFNVYETASYNVFRNAAIHTMSNYVVSEYYDDQPFGACINGIRNENLEQLSFPNNSFDLLLNSDVLEHVIDLDKTLSETKRVLKPGGFHVFTIPVDYDLPKTRERAKIVSGRIEHLMPPMMHGDSIRSSGILAFRDFGKDVLSYMSRDGFLCKEVKYYKDDEFITAVYFAQKQ